jgi:hypothetical protein
VPVEVWRARLEERALAAGFGDQWRHYAHSTAFFVPLIPPLRRCNPRALSPNTDLVSLRRRRRVGSLQFGRPVSLHTSFTSNILLSGTCAAQWNRPVPCVALSGLRDLLVGGPLPSPRGPGCSLSSRLCRGL